MKIIKLGILSFLSSHGIRAKGENLIFSVIVFHSDLLLRRRISFSPPQPPPPPATFRAALLRPETTDFEAHEADLYAGGNPAGKHQCRRRLPPAACRPRVSACGRVAPFPVTRLHIQGRPVPSCFSIPPAVHPEPSLSTFLPILPPPPSISRLLHGLGPLFLHLQFHSHDFKFLSRDFKLHSRDFKLHSRDSPSY